MKHVIAMTLLIAGLFVIPVTALAQSSSDDYRSIAEEILEQPAYSDEQPGLIARFRQWALDQIDLPEISAERPEPEELESPTFQLGRSAILLVVAIAGIIWATSYFIKHRSGIRTQTSTEHMPNELPSAIELERLAEQARAAGDWASAIRFRFRAGVVRLEGKGAIQYSPTLTSGEISRDLDDTEFDDLANTFDAITYGDEAAGESDEITAKSAWPGVIDRAETDA